MVSKDIIKQKLFKEKPLFNDEEIIDAHVEIYQLVQDEVKQELKKDDDKLRNDFIDSDNKIISQVNDNVKEINDLKKRMNEVIERLNKL
ncbi:protein of unknown function [endosymbiont DhMRE of Dentiscutata heterogama]|uniref:hypothetical protein n=1 Tax=endosymbiont DhMRE of Dentiscutata heterogama TaxID=1609546 RepID=UPI000629D4D6|nr:hypothetical protein [endosymbiont DhMRE of Dentiscutata heterogama]CFW92988.1 protein of unknown function [endosymbiont DhMRE of Dentiscutata heterogama]